MKEIIEEIKAKKTEIAKLQRELQLQSESLFDSFFSKIFENCERLKSISWTQYTPYFNDGETCIFHAGIDYLVINGEYEDESTWLNPTNILSYGKFNSKTKVYEGRIEQDNPDFDAELSKAVDEVKDFLSLFDNDFYLSRFGDHTKVTITSAGSRTEDYDHD
jgi:hypothetical protein